jgi:hypothetical protein
VAGLGAHRGPRDAGVVLGCCSSVGVEASERSPAPGGGEDNNWIWMRAPAKQRGQCSIVSQRASGVMLRPHFEQCNGSWP